MFSFALVVPNLTFAARTHVCVLWAQIMKNKKTNAKQIWKHFEDFLVPRLRLSITDRAVYFSSPTAQPSRRTRLRFSISWLARGARLSTNPARWAVRPLIAHGALRLVERSKTGQVVEVRLPDEIRATLRKGIQIAMPSPTTSSGRSVIRTQTSVSDADVPGVACL